MTNADRVTVETTTGEYRPPQGGSRQFVVMLDGNRVGDFDDRLEADATRQDIICSLGTGESFAGVKDRFEKLAVLHAKMAAEYGAIAKGCGDDAERTEDAPATAKTIGDAATESAP